MSYTNETTYYGLPLPTGSDKSTFTDNNTAFEAVDAALHTAYEGAATAAEDITSLKGRMSDAETDIDNLETDLGTEKGKIVALQNKETLQDGEIADVRSDCEGMVCAYNEATSTSTHAYSVGDYFIYNDVLYVATDSITVGATIVPDTNCETTDVATVLKSQAGNVGDLSDLTTTDKSSAVAAINEVKSDLANKTSIKTTNTGLPVSFTNESLAQDTTNIDLQLQGNPLHLVCDGGSVRIINIAIGEESGTWYLYINFKYQGAINVRKVALTS